MDALKKITSGHFINGLKDLVGVAKNQFPVALQACEGMSDDVQAIEQWGSVFLHPKKLTATISKHYLLHKKEMKADIATLESDWSADEYFTAGVDAAALMTVAVGPIEEENYEPLTMPVKAPFEFVSGLLYGFV